MLRIHDGLDFGDFEEKKLERPVPRKEVDANWRIIYMSRDLTQNTQWLRRPSPMPDSAMLGDQHHTEFIQPNICSTPEVILEVRGRMVSSPRRQNNKCSWTLAAWY